MLFSFWSEESVMLNVPEELQQRLGRYGQEHVLAAWSRLADAERAALRDQVQAIDLEQLHTLYQHRDRAFALPPPEAIKPVPVVPLDAAADDARSRGAEALRRGEVAALVVAGGQGSRLGFEHAKGMFTVGPVTERSLYQVHAEKVLAARRRYGNAVPFLIMTSPATHDETTAFFDQHRYFGLPPEEVIFFRQGTMPALDLATGKLLLESPGRLFTSPNGHGGTLQALAEQGLLDRLHDQGIRDIFYFQVDNPLVKVADPVFLGHHRAARAEVSSKVIPKESPMDKLGNVVVVNGRCVVIEYSDLSEDMARQTDAEGRLRFWAGSPAIHLFDVDFLRRVMQGEGRIPFHVARKKVPHVDARGNRVEPTGENAFKFEMFIFDVLPRADRWTVVETTRREEFEPIKNATGPDSPQTARQALSNLAADWLERAGIRVPRQANGDASMPLEISPLYALDAEELAAKVDRGIRIAGPTCLQ
jgi:UDP-N-acetylglucosamine/UDP-N-acetylgalactosamine diphosphorylase